MKLIIYHPTVNRLYDFLSWWHGFFSLIYPYHTFSTWSIFKYLLNTREEWELRPATFKLSSQPFESLEQHNPLHWFCSSLNPFSHIYAFLTIEPVPSTMLLHNHSKVMSLWHVVSTQVPSPNPYSLPPLNTITFHYFNWLDTLIKMITNLKEEHLPSLMLFVLEPTVTRSWI